MSSRNGSPLVLLGPPGAGKGTQAEILSAKLGIPHISTGSILREEVSKGSALGAEAKRYMDRGELAPDGLILGIVQERLARDDCREGFLSDGFPRSVPQADGLDRICRDRGWEVQVVSLVVPVENVVERLSGRRTCRSCGALYHLVFDPPARPPTCDRCGGELFQRDDDREEVITARLDVYRRETAPLLEFYGRKGALIHVDGTGSARQVADRVSAGLEQPR